MNPPFRLSAARAAAQPYVAALGEHSEAVLAELGYAAGRDRRAGPVPGSPLSAPG